MNWKNILIGFGSVVFFSLLYALGTFDSLGNKVYDYFLHFRAGRERPAAVVFLDVDDPAIAYNGVFPWPRSVTADSLLRLKEFGARSAIFDIEFIDRGPQGVDTIYLNQGLPADFGRSFSEINSAAADIFSALKSGRMNPSAIDDYALGLSEMINEERDRLLTRAQGIARDNDLYLIQASALYGNSWATLNLRPDELTGEQAGRRSMAEELFTYPVNASESAIKGKFINILPALPGFARSAKGAGFTNVEIDGDGIRRRIFLAQNVHDHWYLQLAFAPLIDYLGRPEIELSDTRLVIKGAELPGGVKKDISIPLDGQSRMMIDWPPEDYAHSYDHVSFYEFSLLEELETDLEKYARALGETDIPFFAQFDPSLTSIPFITSDLSSLFDAASEARVVALENCSEDLFSAMVDYRAYSRDLIRELIDTQIGVRINALLPYLAEIYPGVIDAIHDEASYITALADVLETCLHQYEEISRYIQDTVQDKFCILGRVDTGTSDIGANPFHAEYVNVGTHGVLLDMILSESFITPISIKWRILFALVSVLLFFFFSSKILPVPRVAAGFAVTILIITAAALLFRFAGIFFSPMVTSFSMISAVIIREIISYAASEREKQFIRKAFSTYVSDEVVKEIIADPSRLKLGGTMRHMSAIFTDLQKFSTIAEKLDPEALVSLLNRYLTAMSNVILEQKGTIDKYEGDAIIAFFGAPMDLPDHAARACLSAIAMKKFEKELNLTLVEGNLTPAPLLTRVGINTGNMVAGNMGTANKMDYTIMGNAVNLSARLEGVNKQYGTWILASDDTIRETGGLFLTRRLDRVRVIGINEPVLLHEVFDTVENAGAELKRMVTVFHQAKEYYEKRDWKKAAEGFREALSLESGGPPAIFLERCEQYLRYPPPDEWDGVINLTQK